MKYLKYIFLLSYCSLFASNVKIDALNKYKPGIFKPDVYITHKLPEDQDWLDKMRPFFFEHSPRQNLISKFSELLFKYTKGKKLTANNHRHIVRQRAKKLGAKEVYIKTEDNFKISSLYFKRKDAPINVIYATGFFEQATPLKEWGAPFAALFPEFNILTFDWRGFGNSSGTTGRVFGTNAYKDILATIDFVRKDNDKPIVLVGFCMGAGICLYALNIAKRTGRNLPDAIVLNSPFTKFTNMVDRIASDPNSNLLMWIIAKNKWLTHIKAKQFKGNILNLRPVNLIKNLNLPCYVEHSTMDRFTPINEGICVYNQAKGEKMFLKSEFGKHVRIHTAVPFQYRNAFFKFLRKINLIK